MGADESLQALRKELGGDPPDGIAALEADELADLAQALRDARVRQARALETALDRSLNLIPGILRGPVKRIVLR